MRRALVTLVLLAGVVLGVLYALGAGWFGKHLGPGQATRVPIPGEVVKARAEAEAKAAVARGVEQPKQILFGDLHVHTTFSTDAFMRSLPLTNGEGAHPVADACDYARFCSALDFWSINDHAEGLTPRQWQETAEAIRQCNAVAGDASNPDVVAFLGWEWTQIGGEPSNHYGHKNVVLREVEAGKVPMRPIAAKNPSTFGLARALAPSVAQRARLVLFAPGGNRSAYMDAARFFQERANPTPCPEGVGASDESDCVESAATPGELFAKLDAWKLDALVIPHGNTWGFYTPAGTRWDKQLEDNDADRQRLVEIFSGHGNSEEYREWDGVTFDGAGNPVCPEPTPEYLPSCYRAGEIIRGRCLAAGESSEECARRADEASKNYLAVGVFGHRTVQGATVEDWLDSGQCRDCYLPAFNYRPGGSSQYALAISRFDGDGAPKRFDFGFIGSSDNHSARAGVGFKEMDRVENTESPRRALVGTPLVALAEEPLAESVPFEKVAGRYAGFQLVEFERQGSFFMTGGLVAVHSVGRDRESIWHALERKEVYATSGERILLWFDYAGPGRPQPMGSSLASAANPMFRAHAVGALRQRPGCPVYSTETLTPERLDNLCRGECYHPSDERKLIRRIEVVRIRPQMQAGEPVAPLIEDPWRTFECGGDPGGCSVLFDDPDFADSRRDATYYVRAVQEAQPVVNGDHLRCDYDTAGNCIRVRPCRGDYISGDDDDCLADHEEKAWSSPIFVTFRE
jgi:hypothetical protein